MNESRDIIKSLGFLFAGIGILLIGIAFLVNGKYRSHCRSFQWSCGGPCERTITRFFSSPPSPSKISSTFPKPDFSDKEIDNIIDNFQEQIEKNMNIDLNKMAEELRRQSLSDPKFPKELKDNIEGVIESLSDPKILEAYRDYLDSDFFKKQLRKSLENAYENAKVTKKEELLSP